MKRVILLAGTRPNFVKVAPIHLALQAHGAAVQTRILHTGQHYDQAMSLNLLEQLGIPTPDIQLTLPDVSSHQRLGQLISMIADQLERDRPDALIVVGDVTSTLAGALAAEQLGIPVVHVEAGLRSFDREMPEEINRILTDRIASRLYTTEPSGNENLEREGVEAARVVLVGNVMIDSLQHHLRHCVPAERTLSDWLPGRGHGDTDGFAVLTLHRPANVDDPEVLASMLRGVDEIAERIRIVFPVHPRTRKSMDGHGLATRLDPGRVLMLPPVGYFEMLGLMRDARLVLTDSGGVQEETTFLGTRCVTLRDNTERPITITHGTNVLGGTDPVSFVSAAFRALDEPVATSPPVIPLWDGRAAERVATDLRQWLERSR